MSVCPVGWRRRRQSVEPHRWNYSSRPSNHPRYTSALAHSICIGPELPLKRAGRRYGSYAIRTAILAEVGCVCVCHATRFRNYAKRSSESIICFSQSLCAWLSRGLLPWKLYRHQTVSFSPLNSLHGGCEQQQQALGARYRGNLKWRLQETFITAQEEGGQC